MCIYIYIYIPIHMCVYTYIYIYIHIYIHHSYSELRIDSRSDCLLFDAASKYVHILRGAQRLLLFTALRAGSTNNNITSRNT